jgi:predicted ATP-dependent protease
MSARAAPGGALSIAGAPSPPPEARRLAPLDVAALRRRCEPGSLGFETTGELPELDTVPGQERALDALRLGLASRRDGFNVFVLGPPGVGKLASAVRLASERARGEPRPDAWCYVQRFGDPRRPRALRMPAGRARPFALAMERLLDELRADIPAALESEGTRARRRQIETAHKLRAEAVIAAVRERARERKVAVVMTPSGITVAPLRDDGEILELEEFRKLPQDEQDRRAEAIEEVGEWLRESFAELPQVLKDTREKLRALDREVTEQAVRENIAEIRAAHGDLPDVLAYLDAVQADILENTAEFVPAAHEAAGPAALRALFTEGAGRRYRVNVLVEPAAGGAPVIVEDSLTFPALFGEIEHRTELGAAVTDFTMIAAGALHRANGGYLIADALRLLLQPLVWEELKRCLRSRLLRIEPLAHRIGLSGQTLEPEPIPLDVRVILVGDRRLYHLLAEHDPEFLELFKLAADFDDDVERSPATERLYARLCAGVARARGTRPLDRDAVAAAIEQAARDAADAGRLSLRVQRLADLLDEADGLAADRARPAIGAGDIRSALAARERRASRLRDRVLDELRSGTILVDTAGERVGQVNGLSVVRLGDTMFGHPSRITARVRVGAGEVMDIEREVELGGPIHSKGVLILTGFLGARFAAERPLSLAASIVFEQSYGPVEGDSASAAELCALLSALAELPLSQSLAVTGSVNQLGAVQPVGGVNQKIEGFFDACRVGGGPTPGQGVIIPASNVQHLMLREDVVAAVAEGRFAVHAVATIDEMMELLTGVPAGERPAGGGFPDTSVNGRVERRLAAFARKRQAFQAGVRRPAKGRSPGPRTTSRSSRSS